MNSAHIVHHVTKKIFTALKNGLKREGIMDELMMKHKTKVWGKKHLVGEGASF